MLIAALGLSAVAFIAIAAIHNVIWLGVWLFGTGFVLLAARPVVLDWSHVHAGPERQGAAVGFLLIAVNPGVCLLGLLAPPPTHHPHPTRFLKPPTTLSHAPP